MKNKRINDIEIRKTSNGNRTESFYEIIKWEPNPYYQKENEYQLNADGEFYYQVENIHCKIHKNCFINPETCYVLAWVKDGNVEFIGNRPFELDKKEFKTFIKIAKSACKKLYKG